MSKRQPWEVEAELVRIIGKPIDQCSSKEKLRAYAEIAPAWFQGEIVVEIVPSTPIVPF